MGDLGACLSTTEYFSGVLNQQPLFITKISQAPVGIRAQVATMKRAYLRVRIPSQLCGSYRHVTIINNYLCGTHRRRERGSRLSGRKAIWSGERNQTHPAASFLRMQAGGKPRTPRWLRALYTELEPLPLSYTARGVSGQRGNRLATPLPKN